MANEFKVTLEFWVTPEQAAIVQTAIDGFRLKERVARNERIENPDTELSTEQALTAICQFYSANDNLHYQVLYSGID